MARRLLLAGAGAGKSKLIARKALEIAARAERVLILTYTINNQTELVRHICKLNRVQPRNVVVKGWFSFLLEDMVRPYQQCIVPERVSGICLNPSNPHLKGKSYIAGRKEKIDAHFNARHFVTKEGGAAHTYFLSKLATRINEVTGGKPTRRLSEIYGAVFIDEVQDLVGWDYQVMRAIADSDIATFECVGDFRQTVYRTTVAPKKPQADTEKLDEFGAMGFTRNDLNISWRCTQSICNLADRLHAKDGHYSPTKSQILAIPAAYADHHGVFAVPAARIEEYIALYQPVILRWSRRAKCELCAGRIVYNFGESKGLGFDRVLIIPTAKHAKFLCGDPTAFADEETDDARNRLYVGITRARYSVAFWYEGGSVINGAEVWNPAG